MENVKKKPYIIALFLLLLTISLFPTLVIAEDVEEILVVDRFPHEELFQVYDTKPGDYAYRTLLLQNNYDFDITYTIQIRNDWLQDSKHPERLDLFSELLLEVTDSNKTIFQGKLGDYSGEVNRELEANSEEELVFKLKFPEELGNEYQAASTNFSLVFFARTTEDTSLVGGISTEVGSNNGPDSGSSVKGISTTEGSTLPKTATNMFTYLLIGGLLIVIGASVSYLSKREKAFPLNLGKIKSFIKFKY